ncbi:MAG: DUF3168 domain-containing protein [Alphaproteobacteria bacterium]|nr:DUF3168 domain-containing protein [Alphaproteobacteria bacterium]
MTDIFFTLQQSLYNALAASAEITALLGSPPRLYDHVPPGAVFPYAVFGATHITPYDNRTDTGFDHLLTIDIWSRYRGSKEAKDIVTALYDTLHRASLPLAGQTALLCECHSAEVALENDGFTTHAAVRFNILTQDD